MFKQLVVLTALAVGSLAWEDGVDCTSSQTDTAGTPGLLYAVDINREAWDCEYVDDASTAAGDICYMTTDDRSELGTLIACPSDPAPEKNPDGTVITPVADGLIKTWCAAASGGPPVIDFVNLVGCLQFGYYAANGDPVAEATTGAKAICNTILAGACTWFVDVAPTVSASMSLPCTDDENSNACSFANPGKKRRSANWVA